MLQQPDKKYFMDGMIKEIEVHERRNHWEPYPSSEIPKGMNIIMSI